MSLLTDIGDYLESNSIGIVNTDIFLSQVPDTPDDVVTVFEYAGNNPSKMADNRSPGLQIRTRSNSYETARAKIEDIYALLGEIGNEYNDTTAAGVEINGTLYLKFEVVQEPLPLGTDSKGRHELAQNFIVTY